MAGLLPSAMRCSAFWYARARGLPQDLGYLKALGLAAYRMAVWEGLSQWRVQEGPYLVYAWPERIWEAAANGPLLPAVQPRDAVLCQGPDGLTARYWRQPPPPGDGFWSYPAPPEDTQAFADWEAMADADGRDEGWGPGGVPWDGDDIRSC